MIVDSDFRSLMLFYAPGLPIEQGRMSEVDASPAVIFSRKESTTDVYLDGTTFGWSETSFDVDVYGLDIDRVESVADNLRQNLNGFRGQMYSTYVMGMFVSDQSEDYTPKLLDADEGFHMESFSVQILHT